MNVCAVVELIRSLIDFLVEKSGLRFFILYYSFLFVLILSHATFTFVPPAYDPSP